MSTYARRNNYNQDFKSRSNNRSYGKKMHKQNKNFVADPAKAIFIGKIDKHLTRESIYQACTEFGYVVKLDMPPADHNSLGHHNKGFVFVHFRNEEVAQNLLHQGYCFIRNSKCEIKKYEKGKAAGSYVNTPATTAYTSRNVSECNSVVDWSIDDDSVYSTDKSRANTRENSRANSPHHKIQRDYLPTTNHRYENPLKAAPARLTLGDNNQGEITTELSMETPQTIVPRTESIQNPDDLATPVNQRRSFTFEDVVNLNIPQCDDETFENLPVQAAEIEAAIMNNTLNVQNASVQHTSVQHGLVQHAPVQHAPVQHAPVQYAPVQQVQQGVHQNVNHGLDDQTKIAVTTFLIGQGIPHVNNSEWLNNTLSQVEHLMVGLNNAVNKDLYLRQQAARITGICH